MSSSQGDAARTGDTSYKFTDSDIRDSSDWTRRIKEKIVYTEYSTVPTIYSDPAYLVRSNSFRLTYAFGRYKCSTTACPGNPFASVVPGTLLT